MKESGTMEQVKLIIQSKENINGIINEKFKGIRGNCESELEDNDLRAIVELISKSNEEINEEKLEKIIKYYLENEVLWVSVLDEESFYDKTCEWPEVDAVRDAKDNEKPSEDEFKYWVKLDINAIVDFMVYSKEYNKAFIDDVQKRFKQGLKSSEEGVRDNIVNKLVDRKVKKQDLMSKVFNFNR